MRINHVNIAAFLGLVVAVGTTPLSTFATSSEALLDGAKLCTHHLPGNERHYGIPTHLLSAIASTESGRYHETLGIKVPWPWTINANGKGYFLESKQEAIAKVNSLRSQGIKSIDVGCMQVNLMHHPDAFASLDQAFDPKYNIAYAASFLRNLYEENKSWRTAASYYHSRTPANANRYIGLVYDHWYKILDKLRLAKMHVPSSSYAALNDMKNGVARVSPVKPGYQPIRMNLVELSKKNRSSEKGIMVVRPQKQDNVQPIKMVEPEIPDAVPVMTLAELKSPAKPVITEVPAPKVIQVAGSAASKNKVETIQSGPRFIFTD